MKPTKQDYMAVMRDTNAWRCAIALSRLTPGVDWRSCTKGHMAEQIIKAGTPGRYDGNREQHLRTVTPEKLRDAITKVNKERGGA